jgi:hypothetical protein
MGRTGEVMTSCVVFTGAVIFLSALIFTSARAVRGALALRRQSRRLAFVCDRCGYSREGLEGGGLVCPECGQLLLSLDPRYDPKGLAQAHGPTTQRGDSSGP